MTTKFEIIRVTGLIVIGFLAGYLISPLLMPHEMKFEEKSLDEQRAEFISRKEGMIGGMMSHGDYACCLEKPCVYCVEKTPGHCEGATFNCLKDVIVGTHPCGECIGEILEGHGNRFLAKYFAKAIAEEVGEQHIDTLRQIVSEKYNLSLNEQL